jgi:hypothetical protein
MKNTTPNSDVLVLYRCAVFKGLTIAKAYESRNLVAQTNKKNTYLTFAKKQVEAYMDCWKNENNTEKKSEEENKPKKPKTAPATLPDTIRSSGRYLEYGTHPLCHSASKKIALLNSSKDINIEFEGYDPERHSMEEHERFLKKALVPNHTTIHDTVHDTFSKIHVPPKVGDSFNFENMKDPVIIPSHGREDKQYLVNSFVNHDVVPIIVVKPGEFKNYVQHFRNSCIILALPVDDGNIGYAREWILHFAKSIKTWKQFIMSDDNVNRFKRINRANDTEHEVNVAEVVTKMTEQMEQHNIGLLALPIGAFDRTRFEDGLCAGWATSFVMYNLEVLRKDEYKNLGYDPRLRMCEDLFFSYKCEKAGIKVQRFHNYRQQKVFLRTGGCSAVRALKH